MMPHDFSKSPALWNRDQFDINSDEVLAQVLDRGTMEDYRALYGMAKSDPNLRARILNLVRTVPLPLPYFWLSAMASLGERIDWSTRPPRYEEGGI